MKGHLVDVTLDMVGINKIGSGFKVRCPVDGCGMPVPIAKEQVSDLMGLVGEERNNVIEIIRARTAGNPDPDDADSADPDDESDLQSAIGGEDDQEIYAPLPTAPVASPARAVSQPVVRPRPAAAVQPQAQAPPMRTRAPAPVVERQHPSALLDDDSTELTPKDMLTAVIEDSGLPPKEVAQLKELVSYADDNWDPFGAKDLFERYGLSGPNVTKLTNRFRNQLELYRRKQERSNNLLSFVNAKSGGNMMGGQPGYGGSAQPGGMLPQPQGMAMPTGDPCAAAIQAIIAAANGVITPQVLAAIDAVRAAYGQVAAAGNALGAANGAVNVQTAVQQNQMQMMSMFKEMLESTQKQKENEETKAKEKAEIQARFDQLQTLILMGKQSTPPPPPADSEHKLVLETLLTMLKEKNTPVVPTAPVAGQSREDKVFDQMFALMLENLKGKPEAAMAPLLQEIADMKDHMSRLGGGYAGLPTNPEQLHGIIDYTKAMAEIKKTESEFSDKAANRELITSLAQTAFQSIGEAAASVFMQTKPGASEQQSTTLMEQPIDDGSVVAIQCPNCKTTMTAPKGAVKVRCPVCNAEFARAAHEKTPEQIAAIQAEMQAIAVEEARLRAEAEAAALAPQVHEEPAPPALAPSQTTQSVPPGVSPAPIQVPSSQGSAQAPTHGPLSQAVMDARNPVVAPPVVAPVEPEGESDELSDNTISAPEEQSVSG